jgi:anthranilate phosphoribosyltransferase
VSTPPPDQTTWPDLLAALLHGDHLSPEQARWAMTEVMTGEATPVQLAGFLVALRAKGETVTELRALADVMLEHANRIDVPGPSIDVVGTGGDRMQSVNISTMASIVVAATGLRVVKHGNRAASSRSGSADVLEALGVSLTLTPDRVASVAEQAGVTFCFAQVFHPSMRHAAVARRDLGVGTVFNVLGPLTNPAQPTYAAVGVADARMAPIIAGVFAERGRAASVFRGDDGLDELTLATTSTVWWVREGEAAELTLDPADLGLDRQPVEALRGGEAAHTAQMARDLLAGHRGAVRDAVVLNAGIALATASGLAQPSPTRAALTEAVRAGMTRAEAAIDSGDARRLLERWGRITHSDG